jgi:outer membrane beta-barrel protein
MKTLLAATLALSPLAALAQPAQPAQPAQNEAVHVVELTPASPRKGLGLEITLTNPVQLNQKFTEHYGLALQAAWHFRENLAWTILNANWFYRGVRTGFSQELTKKAHLQPETASSLTLHWGLDTGLDFAPIYGKFTFMDTGVVHFQIYGHGGIGIASTRVEIRDEGDDIAGIPWYTQLFGRYVSMGRTFGDTGLRPYGVLGAGVRVFLGNSWAVHLEMRDLVYSADVTTINGCTQADMAKLNTTAVTPGCRTDQPDPWLNKQADGALAFDLLKPPDDRSALFTSDVLNNVFFYGGASFLF